MFKHLHKASAFVLVCCAFLAGSEAIAQTNPQPQPLPYSQDFSDLPHNSTAYPDGWQGWQLASSNTSNFRTNAPAADRALAANSSSSTTAGGVHNYNGKLGILMSGSLDPSVAFAVNTLQKTSVRVAFDIMTVRNPYGSGTNTRINEAILQYRVGTSGAFTNVEGTEYQNNTETLTTSGNTEPQKVERIVITLPEATENQEVVQLRWANRDVSGGGSRPSFAVDNIEVTSSSDSQNPFLIAPGSISFGEVAVGQPATTSYALLSGNIAGDVQLTATGGYTLSKQETTGFATSLTFSADEIAENPTVYVRLVPVTAGILTGAITHAGEGFATATTLLSATATSPFVQDFNNCGTTLPGGWKAYSVTGDQVWNCTTFGRETETSGRNNGVQINGFASSARENEDWLISPALNLTNFNIAALTFWSRTAFMGPVLKLMVSTNYDGASAPTTATWTELNGDFPEAASDFWKQSIVDLSAFKAERVYVAFVYTSLEELNGAARWTLDDFAIENLDQLLIASNQTFDFGLVEVPNASDARTFTLSALGYPEGMTLSVGADFQLSKDGQSYASSLHYSAGEASEANTVYVRFKPNTTKLRATSTITYTSGSFVTERGSLIGSSLPKSKTLDIVSWNLAWFGSTSGGPSNLEQQYQNAKKVVQTLDADIIAFQEISNDAQMERLMAELPEYSFVKSDVYSYSQRQSSGASLDPQKLYLVYKNETVKVKSQKVLLNGLYNEILNGRELENYPSSSESFWASGRLPHMVEVEATMNGVAQRIHLLNLHTRANSGSNTDRYEMRKYDVQVLKDSIAAHYPNVNLVLLGDLNDDVDVSVVNNLPSSLNAFVLDENYKTLTYDLSTTGAFTYAGGSFQSFLDHIIVSKSLTDEYIDESITIENQFLSSISNFRSTTSDHIPVSARFSFEATPAVAFSAPSLTKTEGDTPFAVNMSISAAQPKKAHTLYLTIKDESTATAADYTTLPVAAENVIAVDVPANATSATFNMSIVDDMLTEPTEQVTFYINNVTTDLGMAAAARSFTLAIRDNDFLAGIAKGQDLDFRLYPNPTRGASVNISLPERVSVLSEMIVVVRTAEGTKLHEISGNLNSVQQQLNEKVSTLRNGMYLVQVQVQGEVFQTRLVKN